MAVQLHTLAILASTCTMMDVHRNSLCNSPLRKVCGASISPAPSGNANRQAFLAHWDDSRAPRMLTPFISALPSHTNNVKRRQADGSQNRSFKALVVTAAQTRPPASLSWRETLGATARAEFGRGRPQSITCASEAQANQSRPTHTATWKTTGTNRRATGTAEKQEEPETENVGAGESNCRATLEKSHWSLAERAVWPSSQRGSWLHFRLFKFRRGPRFCKNKVSRSKSLTAPARRSRTRKPSSSCICVCGAVLVAQCGCLALVCAVHGVLACCVFPSVIDTHTTSPWPATTHMYLRRARRNYSDCHSCPSVVRVVCARVVCGTG